MELFEPLLNVLLLVGNIIIGMAIYWVLARSKIIEQEENIMELEDTIVQKDTQIEELSVFRQEQEAEI